MINLAQNFSLNSFKGLSNPDSYSFSYSNLSKAHNGKAPDKKIMDVITKKFPRPENTTIVDIGAGDGRNSIPLAEKGFNVLSLEPSVWGKKIIQDKALSSNLSKKVVTADTNIVKTPLASKKDAFVMSHVSQHLLSKELNKAFSNMAKSLNPNGVIMFDALVDTNGEPFENTKVDEDGGCCRFTKKEVLDMAKKNGFKLVENTPYDEQGDSRPDYIESRNWGGYGIENPYRIECYRRPVKLEWFVFEKA